MCTVFLCIICTEQPLGSFWTGSATIQGSVFLDRERQYWGVKTYRLIVMGSLYVQSDALWVFIDSFFRLVTTSTNNPLQFGWFRLKTEVSPVLFESKLENVRKRL